MSSALNILVAEDDFAISLALKTIIKSNFSCEVLVASSGSEAWKLINENSVDIVLSDWNMPEKTGKELLAEIRADNNLKHIPFIMLTARADKTSVVQAAQYGVTDYIHKPFNREELIAKIQEFVKNLESQTSATNNDSETNAYSDNATTPGADNPSNQEQKNSIIDDIVAQLKQGNYELPMLPDISNAVDTIIEENDATISDVAEVIKKDAVITAKIIALANSPLYRGSKEINNLDDAISRVGINETQNFIRVFSYQSLSNSSNPQFAEILAVIRQHSMATAEFARLLCAATNATNMDSLYYFGLMHDIGAILVMQILEDISKHRTNIDKTSIINAIEELHVSFGLVLLKRWGMPADILEIVEFHDDITLIDNPSYNLKIVYLANKFAHRIGFSLNEDNIGANDETMTDLLGSLNIEFTVIEEIKNRVKEYVTQTDQMFASQ